MKAWSEQEAVEFAVSSALYAVDQQFEYASLEEAIESYCFNLQDTLAEYHAKEYFWAALDAYKAKLDSVGVKHSAKI